MSTVHVWSGATGLDDGTSWTDAYPTFQEGIDNTTPVTDRMYVHMGASSPHSESFGTNHTYTSTQADSKKTPLMIFGVDKDDSDAAVSKPSAITVEVTSGDLSFDFSAVMHGLHFKAQDDMAYGNSNSHVQVFVDSITEVDPASSGDFVFVRGTSLREWIDSDITCNRFRSAAGWFKFRGTTLNIDGSTNFEFTAGGAVGFLMDDCDLSQLTAGDTIFTAAGELRLCRVTDTKMPTTWTAFSGSFSEPFDRIEFYNCDDANDYPRSEIYWHQGDVKTDTGVHITSGNWSDETANATGVPLSNKLTPAVDCAWGVEIESLPFDEYIDSTGEKTFRVELIDDFETALQDHEVWLDIFYHATSGQAKRSVATSRVILGDPVADLSAGTGVGNWTGEPASSRSVKLAVTATVNNIGDYSAVVRLAKYEANGADGNPGAALYVAPILTIS